ncbi:hypothetical protein [Bacillus sp. mrc49]|uniref:hypothetical protein n=1 Tax=Bacillus sp. mrc49 TaxID=2054913 RepID=UPI000C275D47|nr:hypothetical protein [Bacillus sp. mrc49]PJN89382.1 hypothetical protein CVN76_15625 [Bacillus sp. mrc49]
MRQKTNKSSLKWLLFTFSSTFISLHITGVTTFTFAFFMCGLLFSMLYLYKEELERKKHQTGAFLVISSNIWVPPKRTFNVALHTLLNSSWAREEE